LATIAREKKHALKHLKLKYLSEYYKHVTDDLLRLEQNSVLTFQENLVF